MRKLLLYACCLIAVNANAGANIDWSKMTAQVASNISARVAGRIAAKTNAVLAIAKPENYALLKSSKLKDAAKKLALQKELAEAALLDAEQTEEGRIKWHGPYISQKIDMNTLKVTLTHKDGTEYTIQFKKPDALSEMEKANAKLPKPPMTNGVPRALAEARARRYEEKTNPQTITTEINATGGKRPR